MTATVAPRQFTYWCMACPASFYDSATSNAHHDETGHNQTWRPSGSFAARQALAERIQLASVSSDQLNTIEHIEREVIPPAPAAPSDRSVEGVASNDAASADEPTPAPGHSAPSPLLALTRALSAARVMKAGLDLIVKQRFEAYLLDNAKVISEQKAAAAQLDALEAEVRALALLEYERTRDKAVSPGIEIKTGKEFVYSNDAALAWATEKQLALIPASLDVTAFKKLASVTPLPFVQIVEVPKVTISTKLDVVLAQ